MPDDRELQEFLKSAAPNPEAALLNTETAEHLRLAVLKVPPQRAVAALSCPKSSGIP